MLRIAITLLLSVLISGCANYSLFSHSVPVVYDAQLLNNCEVLEQETTRAYWHGLSSVRGRFETISLMRQEARKMGGNAVYIVNRETKRDEVILTGDIYWCHDD